jgi:two-component system response regulator MprA
MARILLVDNNDPVRCTLASLLQFEGHEVDQARDGYQALGCCAARRFDVILMDAYMPRMDGLETCRRLRQESQAPVLMLSTNSDPSFQEQAKACGASAFFSKPLEFRGVLDWVRTMVARTGENGRNRDGSLHFGASICF